MNTVNLLIMVCTIYVALLFLVAFVAERSARKGRGRWLRSPVVYTLSLSIYCTAWTFYGAVGYAARSGLEYITIYLGPTIVMIGWWWVLRKLVRVGRSQRVTSIADLISSRFGKSNLLAVGVTILAVVGTTPYIALQLQSVTLSFATFADAVGQPGPGDGGRTSTALWVAFGLALFTVLFGTRNLDANERHHGVVMAIAVEAVIKLMALLAVGIFVVWGLSGGVAETLARIDASKIGHWQMDGGRWAALTFLSGAALLCLPRMFQVMVVENADEAHLRTASWAFPGYLLLMSLFVVPIAVMGLERLPPEANPDLFVLTLPLAEGQTALAILSFLGGFSSATSMVIVAALALSTMVSNHIVMPLWLRQSGTRASVSGDVRHVVLLSRRISIAAIVFLGYLYFRVSGGGAALAAIGLVSFAGLSQVLPVMIGGLYWRGATRIGALAGLTVGFALWGYTLFLPSLGTGMLMPQSLLDNGPFGLSGLRPQALFGIEGLDPLVHAVFWSLSLNAVTFLVVSLASFPAPLERLQGAQFVNALQHTTNARGWTAGAAQAEDLMVMAQRILGADEAQSFFEQEAARQSGRAARPGDLPDPNPDFLQRLERELSGSVGAATAHAMVAQIVGGASVSVRELLAVADETAQMIEYSDQLEAQSRELAATAAKLREANDKLTRLSVQKDAFLSQISHELRTPMTSIRAFSEILRDTRDVSTEEKRKYSSIIHDKSVRLTRLLDDLLDLSVLESGQVNLNLRKGTLRSALDQAVAAAAAGEEDATLVIRRDTEAEECLLETDFDRLGQVFINLIANARKYCDAASPELTIHASVQEGGEVQVDFVDNGSGIPPEARDLIFEKFSRVSPQRAGGAGLGLSICRQIMDRLGGAIDYVPGEGKTHFRVTLPSTRSGETASGKPMVTN
ncbi:ATP-binding protein [Phaeobacter sp. J2-8]|uniref:ATP-binding protein n=1 Tax=Phaeobacter sp. J2-8 TaxID=2931394 RepID=UPI001FD09068|nr:ATP-binding protein [Phaeobacter sp. J2-8]MCJ7874648.1 ATP-binding protein [Phaeobacter sp. J2-8]